MADIVLDHVSKRYPDGAVAVQDVEVTAQPDLHKRYSIDAVPMVLVADSTGDVRASFLGPPPASELWAIVAQVRDDD